MAVYDHSRTNWKLDFPTAVALAWDSFLPLLLLLLAGLRYFIIIIYTF